MNDGELLERLARIEERLEGVARVEKQLEVFNKPFENLSDLGRDISILMDPAATGSGVDLIAFSPRNARPVTVQVTTNRRAKPGGGKGKQSLEWWVSEVSPAHYVAFVDLSSERIWLLSKAEVGSLAQQTSRRGHHFFMYVDPTVKPSKAGRLVYYYEFEKYLLQNRAHEVFDLKRTKLGGRVKRS